MSWFFFALIAATLYSGAIIADKYILANYFGKISELSLTTAAALAGLPMLTVFFMLVGKIPAGRTLITGLIAGWLMLGAFQLYYTALNKADPALVTTLFQIILPFNFIFGLIFFKEHVTALQVIGMLLIAVSSVAISLEQKEKKWHLRADVLLLMIFASLLVSVSDVVFKIGADDAPYLELSLAEYASTVLAGFILFIFSKKIRSELNTLRKRALKTIGFLQFNEALNLSGTLAIRYAVIGGPIALVQGVMGTQPFIVLILSSILAFFGIRLKAKKRKSRNVFRTEILAMIAVCAGSVLISGVAD